MSARACVLCDSPGPFAPVYERDRYRMVRCACGLVFQDPQPGADRLRAAYYHDSGFSEALLGELREVTLANARDRLRRLRAAGTAAAGTRLLDVGASSGAWLEVAADAGIDGVGVELGETTARGARERGLDVRTGTLEDVMPTLGGRRFDLITFWDVLEHLEDPRRELALAAGLLEPGGMVAATFPNIDGLYPRLTYRLIARRTGVWEHPELPVHLYDFSARTSRALLERLGYSVAGVSTFGIPFRHFRTTVLAPERLGRGIRARALRAAFELLRLGAYPIAGLTDRGNATFILARAPAPP
jgi:2-polyprenyl-3-methyl-5-hydroxy-6-metoxy-1,4-benzoquinol methylase